MGKRKIVRYLTASAVTGLYAAAAAAKFKEQAEGKLAEDDNPNRLYAMAAGLVVLTWLVAAL